MGWEDEWSAAALVKNRATNNHSSTRTICFNETLKCVFISEFAIDVDTLDYFSEPAEKISTWELGRLNLGKLTRIFDQNKRISNFLFPLYYLPRIAHLHDASPSSY